MIKLQKYFERPFTRFVDARDLSLFRFLFCIFILSAHLEDFYWYLSLYKSEYFIPLFSEALLSLGEQVTIAHISGIGLIIFLLLSAFGVYARTSLALSCLFYLMFYKPLIDILAWHDAQPAFFVLAILCMAPAISYVTVFTYKNALRRMSTVSWPTDSIILILALAYLSAGLSKLQMGGLAWADGSPIRELFFDFYVFYGREISLVFLQPQYELLLAVAAVSVLVFQNTFWTILFFPVLRPFYIVGGLLFHALIRITTGINFFPYFVILYFVFLKVEWLENLWMYVKARPFFDYGIKLLIRLRS